MRSRGFAHVFRLPDINSVTGGTLTVAERDKAIRASAKFANGRIRPLNYKSSTVGASFFFRGNYATDDSNDTRTVLAVRQRYPPNARLRLPQTVIRICPARFDIIHLRDESSEMQREI